MISYDKLFNMSPTKRDQLKTNLSRMEQKGEKPEHCAALRTLFNRLEADQKKSWDAFTQEVATRCH
jgi:hypothetical protein